MDCNAQTADATPPAAPGLQQIEQTDGAAPGKDAFLQECRADKQASCRMFYANQYTGFAVQQLVAGGQCVPASSGADVQYRAGFNYVY